MRNENNQAPMRDPVAPQRRSRDLTQGPIASTLLWFTLPALGSSVLQSLNASVNAAWIGHYLGDAALAASSNANLLLFFLLGVVFGVSVANSVLVGQAVGAGRQREVKRIVGTSTTFFGAVSVVMALIGYAWAPEILRWMRTPPESQALAIEYLRVIFLALPFMVLYNFLMMAMRGAGDSKTPFWFMLLSVGLDIVLNPLLIFGVGPLPRLGIAGSATSTLIAQAVSLAAMVGLLYHRGHVVAIGRGQFACFRIQREILSTLLRKGIPMGLQMLVISGSALAMISLVNAHGAEVTAAYGVASQLWTYIQMPAMAIGASVSSMAAQNIGANRWDRVHSITRAGIGYNLAMTGVLVLAVLWFDRGSLGLFLAGEAGAIEIARHINAIVAWSFMIFGITIVLFGVIRATGKVVPPLIILVISLWGVRVPFGGTMQERLGVDAIWWSFPIAFAVSLGLGALYYRFGRWRGQRLLSPEPVGDEPDSGVGVPAAAVVER
jgi:putative MATE family efflux protein